MLFERGHFDSSIIQESTVNESLKNIRTFSASSEYTSKPTVFLSHKHDDLKDMRGFMGTLQKHGAKVYIDSMDNRMPNQTSGDTAKRIKEVIKFCDKFILLATDKAIESYWCNWELGIGDTHKYIQNIAILPIKEKGTYDHNFKGNEYLQIYPVIEYRDGTTHYRNNGGVIPRGYYYCKPRDKEGIKWITPLRDWLKETS
ncbi:toll/interleukin-1 receptor domain-containing protein [Carboxylicivirga sediminis]|uniref:Toll/interleukin-1 receptor domain-containing protein n=1 Tax=Carboxylicivirga sediminis TaxID=2006564 RepID=A0A941F7D0_9BACT|nr:toll/interleukin-1 receptor domain-containing protein [Carboxylicivirga sediminis]MBR8537010.1 toll/interleukin-1 receptor domain-containing protein [Carboxylicivirga sediminis]